MRMTTGCVLTALLAVLVSGTAQAAPAGPVMVIKIGGIDMRSVGGATLVLRRINNGAKVFCQGSDSPREIALYADTLRCRREMAAKAVRKLDAPAVTALYDGAAEVRLASGRF